MNSDLTSTIIYLLVFAVASWMLGHKAQLKKINVINILGLLLLILFAGGRYHVGTDCSTYLQIFARYASYSWKALFENVENEWLFVILAKFTYQWGGRVLTFSAFAALTVVPVYFALRREDISKFNITLAMYVYSCIYFATSFNVMREMVAVAIVFWGMKYVYENKFLSFLIVVGIAFGFHLSAFAAILLWFLWDHKRNRGISGVKQFALCVFVAICVMGYQEIIVSMSSYDIFSQYAEYAEMSDIGSNRDIYLKILELVAVIFLGKYLSIASSKNKLILSTYIITVLIGLTGFSHPQVKRVAYYFSVVAQLYFFGTIGGYGNIGKKRMLSFMVYAYATVQFILTTYILKQGNLIPYNFDLFSPW